MAALIQLDLFEEPSELLEMRQELDAVKIKHENVRKGLFARDQQHDRAINELLNMILSLQEELSSVKQSKIRVI